MKITGGLAASALLLAACSSSGAGRGSSPTSDPPANFQTTTCREWLGFPSSLQVVYAEEFLQILHATDQSSAFGHSFAADIARACRPAPSMRVAEIVAGIATLDPADFPR